MIILPSSRIIQPQTPGDINWGNSLSLGLKGAWSFGAGINPPDLITGVQPTISSTPRSVVDIHNALYTSSPNHLYYVNPAHNLNGKDWSIVCKARLVGDSSGSGIFTAEYSGGTVQFELGINADMSTPAPNNRYLMAGVYSGGWYKATDTAQLVVGDVFTAVAVQRQGSGIYLYKNGVLVASAATTTTPSNTGQKVFIGRRHDPVAYFDGNIYCLLLYNRALSAAEAKQISENPWQLFAPQKRQLFISVAGGTPTATSTVIGRLGQTAQGTSAKIAIISLLAKAGSSGQSASTKIASQAITGISGQAAQAASTKIASQAITGTSGQTAQSASTKIASQAITGKSGQAAQSTSTKITSQVITGKSGQTGQITAEQIGAGIITTTVTGRFGQTAQSASTKIASQAITGKSGQTAQSARTKIASQAITGKIGQAAQSAHTKIASQTITAIIGQAGRTVAAPGGIIIPSIDRGYVVSPENRNYLVSPENRNYSISL